MYFRTKFSRSGGSHTEKIHHLNHVIQTVPSFSTILQFHQDENYHFHLVFFLPQPEQGLHYGLRNFNNLTGEDPAFQTEFVEFLA